MQFLQKRIFPGFRIGELLIYITFNVLYGVILASLYQFGGHFGSEGFITLDLFIDINLFTLGSRLLLLLPVWYLFIRVLKNKSLLTKILLHIPTAAIFVVIIINANAYYFIHILEVGYPRGSRLSDSYTNLVNYCLQVSVFHCYNFYLETKERLLTEQRLKDLAHESEIQTLKAQIEPHFLFNTLNSISASVPPALEKTRVLIAQLADTFRYALQVNEYKEVPLEEEVDFIKTWLALEKHRFNERLNIKYFFDEAALKILVPPMILQPIVENALTHGISPKIEGGTVTIECRYYHQHIQISVSDTGVGYEGNARELLNKGVGLSNVAKRLKLLYNQPIIIEKNQDAGLRIHFTIPVKK